MMDAFDRGVIEILEEAAGKLEKEAIEIREMNPKLSFAKFKFSEAARKAAGILKNTYGEEEKQ